MESEHHLEDDAAQPPRSSPEKRVWVFIAALAGIGLAITLFGVAPLSPSSAPLRSRGS